MRSVSRRVDDYIDKLPEWQQRICQEGARTRCDRPGRSVVNGDRSETGLLPSGCQGESQYADVHDDSFEDLVDEAVARIPEPFQSAALRTVAIVVEDEPTASQLAAAGARRLFGLYQGVPRTAWGADAAMVASKITIFRGPLRRAHPTPAALATAVDDVIRHEIAHHLGIDDQRLIALRRRR